MSEHSCELEKEHILRSEFSEHEFLPVQPGLLLAGGAVLLQQVIHQLSGLLCWLRYCLTCARSTHRYRQEVQKHCLTSRLSRLFDKEDKFRVITRGLNSEEIFSKFINTTHFVEAWMKREISFNTEGVYNDIINQIRRVLVQSERRTNVPQNKFHHL